MSDPVMAEGTIEGTGAALNVSCGFKPKSVDVWNIDDPTIVRWCDSLGDGHGVKTVAAGTTTHIATGGITPYDGAGSGGQALQGTVAGSAGSRAIAGTSTFFTEELEVGDLVKIGQDEGRVLAIGSNTALTLSEPLSAAASGATAYRLTRASGGFTIGTDADLNVNSQTLYWRAFR